MSNIFSLFIKGLIIGMGQIIPGVSGGMLAITLGLYEKGIDAISNFFDNVKDNFRFLFPLGLGILTSILIISKIIKYALCSYYFPTMLLFIGLILGGVPSLFNKINKTKNKKNYLIFIIVFIFILLLSLINEKNTVIINNISVFEIIILFIIGIIYASTMVIPGVSGTAIMMLIGYYDLILTIISSITNFSFIVTNFYIILPILIGFIFGIIVVSKLMNYLLKKYKTPTYYGIFGLVLSSILIMILNTFKSNFNFIDILMGFIFLILGFNITKRLEKNE